MRRFAPGLSLLLAACAGTPPPAPLALVAGAPRPTADLIGLTAAELQARFGPPALQVREGPGVKLQFMSSACVLDSYLYPPANGGAERVTHVDARTRAGMDTDRAGCIATFTPSPRP